MKTIRTRATDRPGIIEVMVYTDRYSKECEFEVDMSAAARSPFGATSFFIAQLSRHYDMEDAATAFQVRRIAKQLANEIHLAYA